MIRKLLICPWFGALPEWMDKYYDNIRHLKGMGYDFLITQDLVDFKQRVKRKLGIECPIVPGTGKVHDYRCAFGELFQPEIWYGDYQYWGFTDFDMVFGDVAKWFSDEKLTELDIWSNHGTYICGPWTLFKNTPEVNSLFRKSPVWKEKMIHPQSNGWVEMEYSREVENSGLKYKYDFFQGNPYTTSPNLKMVDDCLYQDGEEIAMFHFRRSKKWPI